MFTERKISAFQRRIADLPDTPTLTASELKARFDACPEELRQALNGVCDDGKALENRIDAYRAQTFEGEITREMLAPNVQEELSGKADAQENTKVHETMLSQISAKCEVVFGIYTGDDAPERLISLGFAPKAVLVLVSDGYTIYNTTSYGGLALPGHPAERSQIVCTSAGFQVHYDGENSVYSNSSSRTFYYIAFK